MDRGVLARYLLLSMAGGRNYVSAARRIRERLRWSRERMEAFRVARCRELLRHAGARVPYYRAIMRESGFDPATFSSLSDLQRLPVLTRERLRRSFADLTDVEARSRAVTRVSTGGTTGEPATVLLERRNHLERMLITHRMYSVMGRGLGVRTLLVAGSPFDARAWASWRERMKNRLFDVDVVSSFTLTADVVARLLDRLRDGRYRFVIAYASVFDLLAAACEERGETMSIPAIIPCAELVTAPQRQRWGATLGAEIFEIYGSREMNSIAAETSDHDGLVVNGDIYHVEITDADGVPLAPGAEGLITITSLVERAMPLVRYQLGDIGAIREPLQGQSYPFPRLRITHGRVLDLVVSPSGKILPGEFFPHLMKEVSDLVERFQVVQTALDRIVVKVVRHPNYDDSTSRYLEGKIREQLGPDMRVDFEFPTEIRASASGKYRPTMSLLPADTLRAVLSRQQRVARSEDPR